MNIIIEMSESVIFIILNLNFKLLFFFRSQSFLRATCQKLEVIVDAFESGSESIFEFFRLLQIDSLEIQVVRKVYLIEGIHWLIDISTIPTSISLCFCLSAA